MAIEEKVWSESPIKAIGYRCLDCGGGSSTERKNCPVEDCILHNLRMGRRPSDLRSEEHTSELQSHDRPYLVCRLLLEIGRASCRERV